jgi:pimeloyl-ACP methyl ester carboxylesterase
MPTRHNAIDIPVDGQHIDGTLVAASNMVPGVLLVHGWDGSQEQYIARAHEIAALGCVCLTFDLRGHARHAAQRRRSRARTTCATCWRPTTRWWATPRSTPVRWPSWAAATAATWPRW